MPMPVPRLAPLSGSGSGLTPELPAVDIYIEALESRVGGQPVECVRIASLVLPWTVEPPLEVFRGRRVLRYRWLGKRVGIDFEDDW